MIERFCDGKPASIINDERMPEKQQKKVAEWLSYKLESFLWDNVNFFKKSEVVSILEMHVKK